MANPQTSTPITYNTTTPGAGASRSITSSSSTLDNLGSISSASSASSALSVSDQNSASPTTILPSTTLNQVSPISTTSQSTGTPSATSSTPTPLPASSHRLSNGAVAGIARQGKSATVAKQPFTTEAPAASGTYESYLPQSADDRTVQQKAKATLDQIELHVENFYRSSSSSAARPDNAELAAFDSPYLPAALASLLPRSKNRVNIIKHALAQCIVASISPTASPARSLLPTEYALLPHTVNSARSSISHKVGSAQIMSRWRVMTTYLLPEPTKDAAYIAQRDKQIGETVQSFARAFAPWKSTGYKDEERARSLSAILEDAANLGIFLFSQPSTIKFHWPSPGEIGASKIVVSPALLKTTDEKGQDLVEDQVMVSQVVLDA